MLAVRFHPSRGGMSSASSSKSVLNAVSAPVFVPPPAPAPVPAPVPAPAPALDTPPPPDTPAPDMLDSPGDASWTSEADGSYSLDSDFHWDVGGVPPYLDGAACAPSPGPPLETLEDFLQKVCVPDEDASASVPDQTVYPEIEESLIESVIAAEAAEEETARQSRKRKAGGGPAKGSAARKRQREREDDGGIEAASKFLDEAKEKSKEEAGFLTEEAVLLAEGVLRALREALTFLALPEKSRGKSTQGNDVVSAFLATFIEAVTVAKDALEEDGEWDKRGPEDGQGDSSSCLLLGYLRESFDPATFAAFLLCEVIRSDDELCNLVIDMSGLIWIIQKNKTALYKAYGCANFAPLYETSKAICDAFSLLFSGQFLDEQPTKRPWEVVDYLWEHAREGSLRHSAVFASFICMGCFTAMNNWVNIGRSKGDSEETLRLVHISVFTHQKAQHHLVAAVKEGWDIHRGLLLMGEHPLFQGSRVKVSGGNTYCYTLDILAQYAARSADQMVENGASRSKRRRTEPTSLFAALIASMLGE